MDIHIIRHAEFESAGILLSWARQHGYQVSETHVYRNEKLPTVKNFDMLVIMGGPQSPIDIDNYPYLIPEITLIQQAIVADKKVLGFCLGAQLIGEAFGARTELSPEREIGVFPIQLTESGRAEHVLADFPDSLPVVHWHRDMPGLPAAAEVLARSAGCPRQIICFNDVTYGFQCHLEMGLSEIERLIKACDDYQTPGPYVQSPATMREQNYDNMQKTLMAFLDRFVAVPVDGFVDSLAYS